MHHHITLKPDRAILPFRNETEKQKLINVFGYIDVDGGGEVTIKEIMNWGRATRGKPYTPAEIKHIMAEYDEDGNGVITLDEWIHYHENMIKHPHRNQAAEEFSHVDDKTLWEMSSKLSSMDGSDASNPTLRLSKTSNSNSLGLQAPKKMNMSFRWSHEAPTHASDIK